MIKPPWLNTRSIGAIGKHQYHATVPLLLSHVCCTVMFDFNRDNNDNNNNYYYYKCYLRKFCMMIDMFSNTPYSIP